MKIQTITIQLKLKDGQEPYDNEKELSAGGQYDHLRRFFEEFGPPSYEVLDIESKVDEEPPMSASEAGLLAGIIEFELDHPRDGKPNPELDEAHSKLIMVRDGIHEVVKKTEKK